MLNGLKRLFGGREIPAESDDEQTIAGESLDQDIDAVRQTQVIDPSQFRAAQEAVQKSRPKSRRRSKSKTDGRKSESSTPRYRPSLRPPMGFLAVLDDGSIRDAEIHRLSGGDVVIGRQAGDIQFPHEVLMSSKHAQLECRRHRAGHQWHFTDLNSRNGSFFRVQQAYLRHDQELLIGRHRIAFQIPPPGQSTPHSAASDAHATQLIQAADISLPRLVYRDLQHEAEQTHVLKSSHIVIGTDAATCGLSVHDPYVCPNHARIHHTSKGWMIEDLGSRNGVWLRLHQAKLDQITEFQLGEQRFYFRPPKAGLR